jgi:RHS repeat-associated protein
LRRKNIHVDHLNTPRLVADSTGTTVWRWDQAEPFGSNPPDENPSGLGTFDLPLRLPGQYYDKETNLHYNYFRDYDPSVGRYVESDPIGLRGGFNTYAYAASHPLGLTDPTGEIAILAVPFIGGGSTGFGAAFSALAGGAAMAAILSVPGSTEQAKPTELTPEQEAARDAEHKRYKQRCEEKPPTGLGGCDLLRWLLQQARDCRDMRQQWDDRWMPGRHAQAIREWTNRIRNLERLIAQRCASCP